MIDKTDVEPGRLYKSINDVYYRVISVSGQKVIAECASGHGAKPFEISLGRFAASMQNGAVNK